MFTRTSRRWALSILALARVPLMTSSCGSGETASGERESLQPASAEPGPEVEPNSLIIEQRTGDRVSGRYTAGEQDIVFSSESSSPLEGDVTIAAGSVTYDVHYDYEGREVVTDGHGGALDRTTVGLLSDAVERASQELGRDNPALPLHEQMLYASLAMLEGSAGMPLPRMTYALDPSEVDKSLGNDGVTCIKRDTTYAVSFDYGSNLITDEPITSNTSQCNGQCGPSCTRLTPWVMWTLDCLEHDTCCGATSNDPCWTPLGECGDEYNDAQADFLRGFDPFGKHCGG